MARRARPGEINYSLLDRFAIAHFVFGGVLSAGGATAIQALATSVAWELVEPTLKETYPRVFPHQTLDTTANKLGDTAAWMLGFALVEVLKENAKPTVRTRRRKPKRLK